MLLEPIRLSFEVACAVDQAFRLWTERIGTWWPADHSVSGESGLQVVLDLRLGGRLYERTSSGATHEWG